MAADFLSFFTKPNRGFEARSDTRLALETFPQRANPHGFDPLKDPVIAPAVLGFRTAVQ